MTGQSPPPGSSASAPAGKPVRDEATRRSVLVAVGGGVVLLIGIIVLVLGLVDASSGSKDLSTAQQQLNSQRKATQQAQNCKQAYQSIAAPVLADGKALLSTANQIAALNQQVVTATHDEQAAGIANNIDAYNAAVARANAARDSSNSQIDTLNRQLTALQQAGSASPGCGV